MTLDDIDRRFAHMPESPATYLDWVEEHARVGSFATAEPLIRRAISRFPDNWQLLWRYALLQRETDCRDDAAAIIDHLLRGQPGHAGALHLRALIEMERGGDARAAFARAMGAAPADEEVVIGTAAAHHRAGDRATALALLQTAAGAHPEWTGVVRTEARFRWESGDERGAVETFERAILGHPSDVGRWMNYAGFLASAQRYDAVVEIMGRATAAAGEHVLFDMLLAQALSETGDLSRARTLFERLDKIDEPSFLAAKLRSLLRLGQYEEVERLAERQFGTAGEPQVWPYLAIAWRAMGDDRIGWLEAGGQLVAGSDLDLSAAELAEIATFVRALHQGGHHPHDQSARGGTQTHGNLLDRTDPPIERLRQSIRRAIRLYLETLPPRDPNHPFLGPPRHEFRFAGSWSIRLSGSGHHVPHVHPMGWISSALHLTVPPAQSGEPDSGRLAFGRAPPELGLSQEPTLRIDPKPGRLVLFPSWMWHGTEPFAAGERLTVAFDVVPYAEIG